MGNKNVIPFRKKIGKARKQGDVIFDYEVSVSAVQIKQYVCRAGGIIHTNENGEAIPDGAIIIRDIDIADHMQLINEAAKVFDVARKNRLESAEEKPTEPL